MKEATPLPEAPSAPVLTRDEAERLISEWRDRARMFEALPCHTPDVPQVARVGRDLLHWCADDLAALFPAEDVQATTGGTER